MIPPRYWLIRMNWNRFLGRFSKRMGVSRAWSYPTALMIEPTNRCNLSCFLCPTGAGWLKHPQGFMDVSRFERLLKETGPYLQRIAFWNWGEPFMHPDLLNFIASAQRYPAWLQIATNGHFFLDPNFARQVIESGLDQLVIAMDGASTASIQAYRGPHANLDRVLQGLRNLASARERLAQAKPHLDVQFLVMAHNQDEIDHARKLAMQAGADRFFCKTLNLRLQELAEPEAAKRLLPKNPRYSRFIRTEQGQWTVRGEPDGICPYIYETAVVLWDGSLVPCCFDAEESIILGNAFEAGLRTAWNSPAYQHFRRQVRHRRTSLAMCAWCPEERSYGSKHLGRFWTEQ